MEQCDLLLEYLRQQKEKAYELLYHDYYVPLVLFAGKYVGNEEVTLWSWSGQLPASDSP